MIKYIVTIFLGLIIGGGWIGTYLALDTTSEPLNVLGASDGSITRINQWLSSSTRDALVTRIPDSDVWMGNATITVAQICLTGDTCETEWPAGGGGSSLWESVGSYLQPLVAYVTKGIKAPYYVASSTTDTNTFAGAVAIGTSTSPNAKLTIGSSFAGGENTTDSTGRIQLSSWQRAESSNHFGEPIRLDFMKDNAKAMIAWRDGYTNPSSPKSVAWIGAHDYPNDVADPRHSHISIETKASTTDEIYTRFGIDYNKDIADIDFNLSNITIFNDGVSDSGRLYLQNDIFDSNSFQFFPYNDRADIATSTRNRTYGLSIDLTATSTATSTILNALGSSKLFFSDDIINLSQRIGLGTSSPSVPLELWYSDANTTVTTGNATAIRLTNSNTTNNNMSELSFTTLDTSGTNLRTSAITGINTSHSPGVMSGALAFVTRNAGTYAERMRIQSDGSVAVGTTTSDARFSIWGNGTGTGSIFRLTNSASSTVFNVLNNGSTNITGTTTLATTTVTDLTLTRGLRDTTGVLGTSGQLLQSTGTSTRWITGGGGGSGTVNSGDTGQFAYYTATGTAVSGSSILTLNSSSVRVGTPTITPSIPLLIETNEPSNGYTSMALKNTANDGRSQMTFSAGSQDYYNGFIGMSGSTVTNWPNTMEVGCGSTDCGINLWSDGFLQGRLGADGNFELGTTTVNPLAKFTIQALDSNANGKIIALHNSTGAEKALITNGGTFVSDGGYRTPYYGVGYAVTSGYGTSSSVIMDFFASSNQAVMRGFESNGIGFRTGVTTPVERLRIGQSGLVSIGTTTPTAVFTVQGTTSLNMVDIASSTGQSVFKILASGAMELLGISEPSAPSTGRLLSYAKNIAGKLFKFSKNPAGQAMPPQDALWNATIVLWRPTTVTAGLWVKTAGAGAGTFANTLPSNSSLYTQQKRARYSNVATTSNQVLGQRNTEAIWWRGDSAGEGGFFTCYDFGYDTWTNGGRHFSGLHSGTTVISADPSALNNTVGFAVDAGDNGAISFLTRSTSATKAPTGLTIVSGKGYKGCFYASPNSSEIGWWIKDINAGTEASGTATTTLPSSTTFLTIGSLGSNGALTAVNAIQLGVINIYAQTDY
jgi:hypothetical protein